MRGVSRWAKYQAYLATWRHLKNSLLHFMMAKRDRLESGAVLAEGCAVGVSLHYMLALVCFWVYYFVFKCTGQDVLLE